MEKNGESNEIVRKVAPIRVVNLASLQDIKVVNKEPIPRHGRRKSIHVVRSNSEEQIEFIESQTEFSNDESSNSTIASSSNSIIASTSKPAVQPQPRSIPVQTTQRSLLKNKRQGETRPNENLMKRVALLRVCAEYMLKELQINNVVFGENQSLDMLKAQYIRNSRMKH